MGISNLSRLCSAVFFATSLAPVFAADPPVPRGNVSATVNPTTGYYVSNNTTVRLPSGVSVSPNTSALPVVTKYSGGLQQTIPSGITIDAIKKTAPLSATVRATTQSVKGAATRCLTSAKCNFALILAGAGLEQLFDGLDWVMGEGGQISRVSRLYPEGEPSDYYSVIKRSSIGRSDCGSSDYVCFGLLYPGTSSERQYGCSVKNGRSPLIGYEKTASGPNTNDTNCYYGSPNTSYTPPEVRTPLSSDEVTDAVESSYSPEPSDWPALTPELELDDVEITWAPTLESNPKTTTVYDADGNPVKVQETSIWYDFDIRDNPSPMPALDLKTREETKTYENGVLTGTTSTTNTASGGVGDTPPPPPEVPTDCDFMPTVCAFMDWFKDDDLGDDPDLKSIMKDEEDFARSKTISFGAAVCPAPHTINLPSLGMSVDLSFEFFCQFAEYARALVLAAAYIFAAYISLGVARG